MLTHRRLLLPLSTFQCLRLLVHRLPPSPCLPSLSLLLPTSPSRSSSQSFLTSSPFDLRYHPPTFNLFPACFLHPTFHLSLMIYIHPLVSLLSATFSSLSFRLPSTASSRRAIHHDTDRRTTAIRVTILFFSAVGLCDSAPGGGSGGVG